jgi:hypothetical protein
MYARVYPSQNPFGKGKVRGEPLQRGAEHALNLDQMVVR